MPITAAALRLTHHRGEPSPAQKEAGNYKKHHVNVHGLDIAIENPRGSQRRGIGKDGKPWSVKMPAHYGYIKRTEGADGDHVDCYIGPHLKSPRVVVIDQVDGETGRFDEHKCMLGFASVKQALAFYKRGFSDGKGNDRVGGSTEMTIDQFKDWLKHSDTTKPLHRAGGGRTPVEWVNLPSDPFEMAALRTRQSVQHPSHEPRGYADGGAPAFDPSKPFEAAAAPAFDPTKPFEPAGNDIGRGHAALEGYLSGASANFSDEVYGASKASGLPDILGGFRAPVGAARLAYEHFAGDGEATKKYETAVAEARERQKRAQEQYPGTYLAGNVGGTLASTLVTPGGALAQGATLPARIGRGAAIGAGYGGLSGAGEGENLTDRATKATTGALVGGVLGGATPPVLEGVLQAGSMAARPLINTARGLINPEGEAGRRVITALDRDMTTQGPNLTPQEIAIANQANVPRSLIDAGGETTRALARSAANTSPEAREGLARFTGDRFGAQNERASEFVDQLVGGTQPNVATRDQLQTAARNANRPAYAKTFNEHDGPMWDEPLSFLAQDPVVQGAIRRASTAVRTDRTMAGFGPLNNPFTFEPSSGRLTLRTDTNGKTIYPDLRFWDQVKRQLDADKSPQAQAFSKSLRGHLDEVTTNPDTGVSSYREARSGAARFFGAEDALEAGQKFVTSKMANEEARRALAKMSPPERTLFQQGYASQLINQINETGDRRSILNAIGQSPAARERMELALGPQRARSLETYLRVEGIVDRARTAVTGNSTTARQLAELGLAGGAYGIGSGGDPLHPSPSAIAGAAIAYGLSRGHNRINEDVARRVGQMLVSNDPNVLARGVQMVARSQRIFDGLRRIEGFGARAAGQEAPNNFLRGVIPSRADDNQKNP